MKTETLLAFDVGLKRTGVACGQTLSMTAQPAGQLLLKHGRFNWVEVDQLVGKWAPDKIIIGNPGSDDPRLNKTINRLKSHIQQKHKLPIVEVDETLTSNAANQELGHSGLSVKRKTKIRDQLAARLILESYFSSISQRQPPVGE